MKKKCLALLSILVILIVSTSQAASYTLPEKMYNQLAIGSGLKGSFVITAEGERYDTPFMKQITDAEFDIRGIISGKDLHYYIFQQRDDEHQTGVNELYRKDGVYFFRSDMVQGKTLEFPTLSQYLEMLFPAQGENASSSSFVSKILTLSEADRKDRWDPVLNRYQKELEMWLADFAVQADSVRLENGLSALDLSYDIPMSKVNEQILTLYSEFISDSEVMALLGTVMTEQEKDLYFNGNLLYFYQDALNSLNLNQSIRMSKRVSAMGELLRFKLELPLDERTAGFESVSVEMTDKLNIYTLRNSRKILSLTLPDTSLFTQPSYNLSVWFACIHNEKDDAGDSVNAAYRADIRKTSETYNDENEKSHETDHFRITVEQDTVYLPEDIDLSVLPEADPVQIDVDLHYSSKFAQNSATTLEIKAEMNAGNSSLHFDGKVKTAAPWLFMPFEVIDPIQTGTGKDAVLESYFIDWICNASSIIHHIEDDNHGNADSGVVASDND